MNWQLYPTADFAGIRDAWQSLCSQRYQSHPLLDVRFIDAALDAFADDTVRVAVAADDPSAGIAIVRLRSMWMLESFCPSQLPMAQILWHGSEINSDVLRELLGAARRQMFGVLHYDELYYPPVSDTGGLVESIDYAPTMNVHTDGEFDAYWSARSKNLRRNIARYQNRANRDKLEITLEDVTSATDMPAALAAYGELESAGWKGQEGSAIHADNLQGRFYLDLLLRFAATGDARVMHLRMNDNIVASRILVQSAGTAVILKTTYDENYSRYAPGRILLYMVLQTLFADPRVQRVEFYTKANADQLQWASGTRMIRHYNIYRSKAVAQLGAVARRMSSWRG